MGVEPGGGGGADATRPLGTVVERRGMRRGMSPKIGNVGGVFFSEGGGRSDEDEDTEDEDAGDEDTSIGGGAGGGGASGTEGDGHDEPAQV